MRRFMVVILVIMLLAAFVSMSGGPQYALAQAGTGPCDIYAAGGTPWRYRG